MFRMPSRGRCALLLPLILCASVAFAKDPATAANARQKAAQPAAAQKPASAAGAGAKDGGSSFADGIAAVVNKDIITMSEVREYAARAKADLTRRNIQIPPDDVLNRQVLEQLIMTRLQHQEADRLGIKVDNAAVDQAIQMIAARNHLSVDQLRKEVEKTMTWPEYRKTLNEDVLMDRVRQRAVDSTIDVSDAEVDAFLKDQGRTGGASLTAQLDQPDQTNQAAQPEDAARQQAAPAMSANTPVGLAQILVRVPEGASPDAVAALRQKAQGLLARARKGEDFAALAAANSDAPEALRGGQLGVRPLNGWPDLFVRAIASLAPGQVSGIVQSGIGFHILKVLSGPAAARAAKPAPVAEQRPAAPPDQGPVHVTQTHARHILIKVSAITNEQQAHDRLEEIAERIKSGNAKFEDMARQYSEDASAPQGGDLGWLNPGETVPAFEKAMDSLKVGEISEPVQSPFGWHLIQVLDRREQDVSDLIKRNKARQILFERRATPAYEDWLEMLRAQAYIDNRLEPKAQQPQ